MKPLTVILYKTSLNETLQQAADDRSFKYPHLERLIKL